MPLVIVSAETEQWTTRPADPSDRWDTGDTRGQVKNVIAFLDPRQTEGYRGGESCARHLEGVKPGDTVFAVVADYESGSTFGRDGGYAQVLDVFTTQEEAGALLQAARKLPESESYASKYSFTHNGREYHRSWVGYFEQLQELAVWEIVVRARAADPFRKVPDDADGYTVKRGS